MARTRRRLTMQEIHLGRVLQGSDHEKWVPNQRQKSEVVKFLERVEITPNDCWSWLGVISHNGYGQCRIAGAYHAHRASYLLFVGPIEEGLVVDHLCENKSCVNPDHLRVTSNGENIRRSKPWRACDELHPNDPTRLGLRANGRQFCRECQRVREAARRARFAEAGARAARTQKAAPA